MILEAYKQHELQMNQLHDEIRELRQRLDDQHREAMDNLNGRLSNAALQTHTKYEKTKPP